MKKLITKFNYDYCSEVVAFNGKKFKIVSSNDNSYSRLNIYVFTNNGDLALIANRDDVPNYLYVDYIKTKDERLELSLKNIAAAEKYIKAVYSE